ncbi:unnamed protein product [Brassicogethes aeneus]|uniref:Uncharacterized protein n=1 Tax=Brassicogethes aeneus TaxID=1431903 RepID=A0A9P0B8G5_BRAAE|nr:unnamed protein product [Brassicogethes aeneus]
MDFLTVEEKIEMILIYGEAGRNLDDVNIYAQSFPDKIRSRHFSVQSSSLLQTGVFNRKKEFVKQQLQFKYTPSYNDLQLKYLINKIYQRILMFDLRKILKTRAK